MSNLSGKLDCTAPKRLLALDGGGIRGCISIGFLEQIEQVLRSRTGKNSATLSDYFDLIGGTSTGAILAAQLALGAPVEDVKARYVELGAKVFSKPTWQSRIPVIGKRLFTNWSIKPLERELKTVFSDKITLGSPAICTGLCIVTKRADTFSTWPYINHPKGRFYAENADIPLWKLLRASSAAPSYFKPIRLDIGEPGKPDYGAFVDGGVSLANNPALQLFLLATLKGFPFHWKPGRDRLLIVSIGTGRWAEKLRMDEILRSENLYWAQNVPGMFMQDASELTELLLQYMSNSPTRREIDWEVGDLGDDLLGGQEQFTYLRYNAILERVPLGEVLGETLAEEEILSLRDLAAGKNAERLYQIGKACAGSQVLAAHFPKVFDI